MIFPKTLLLLTVFLIPLFEASHNLGYEQIKVFFFITSLTVCGILWVIYVVKHPVKIVWSGINKAAILFICILFLTSTLGIDTFSSFVGKEPYFQGFIFYAYLYLFFLLVSSVKASLKGWAYVLVGSSTLVSLLAIGDWVLLNLFGQVVPSYAGRVVSTFGQPNFYAGFLLLSLPFSYLLFKNSARISQGHSLSTQGVTLNKLSYFGMISGLISVIGIFVSYSRSTILLALILVLLGLINELKVKFKTGLIAGAAVLGSITIALSVSSGLVGNEVSKPLMTQNPDLTKESVEKRVYIWPVAWQLILQKPLIGYGLENIGAAFTDYFEKNKHLLFEENLKISPVLISLKELNINRTHNYLLDLLIFSGILGMLGWFGLVGVLFKKLRQISHGPPAGRAGRTKNVLLVSLVTYLIWVQFQNQSMVHLVYFWLLVGLIDQQNKLT